MIDEVLDLIDDVVRFYSDTGKNGMFTAREFGELLKEEVKLKLGESRDGEEESGSG